MYDNRELNKMNKPKRTRICKIVDPRIANYTKRTRSGTTQEFYTGNDARDWNRYRAEGGGQKANVKMHLKPDTIHIKPPKNSYYAELIDGEWWWVEGCAECNGEPRGWMTYVECDKHNVCRSCGCSRESLTEPPLAGKQGWQCKPCAEEEHEAEKSAALLAMSDEYDEWDYFNTPDIRCPYCDYKFTDTTEMNSAIDREQEEECPRCDNTFSLSADIEINWTTKRIESA